MVEIPGKHPQRIVDDLCIKQTFSRKDQSIHIDPKTIPRVVQPLLSIVEPSQTCERLQPSRKVNFVLTSRINASRPPAFPRKVESVENVWTKTYPHFSTPQLLQQPIYKRFYNKRKQVGFDLDVSRFTRHKVAVMKKLLDVLNGNVSDPPPVWLMRQAGRYLPEYKAVRDKAGDFLSLCFNPELAAEVTLQPVRRFGMDAAILFSDILVIPHMLGQEVTFVEGEGPKLGALDIDALVPVVERVAPVFETVRRVKQELPEHVALIGFAGSPWTVASYMLRGHGGSEDFSDIVKFSNSKPAAFEKLIDRIIDATLTYLEGQIEAGAEVIQLFDSWAGKCENVHRWIIEPTAAIVMILRSRYPKLPIIGFPRLLGPKHLGPYVVQTGLTGLSLDPHIDPAWAVASLSRKTVLQGNLDPEVLREGGAKLSTAVTSLLQTMKDHPFIFNLGHGVNKDTPPEHVAELVALVRRGLLPTKKQAPISQKKEQVDDSSEET